MNRLLLSEIKDDASRKNFETLSNYINSVDLLKGQWRFMEIRTPAAVTNFKFKHNLNFTPKDILVTSTIGGVVTWNYSLFDGEFLNLTTSAPLVVRAFVGTYSEG
jgi:hypothetical protein